MFKEFDSLEDAFQYMQEQEKKANENLHPVQKTIVRGMYAIRPAPEVPCLIFGYIYTEDELRAGEINAGADEEEADYTLRILNASYERGYRTGRWYSIVEPDGEFGDAHISNLWPIRKEDFLLAKEQNWKLEHDQYRDMLVRGYAQTEDQ